MKLPKRVKSKDFFWMGVTATASVAMLYFLLPIELAIISIIVLFFHEFAHFLSAIRVGAKPSWPLFIPLGIFIMGKTKVKDLDIDKVATVALSGPIVGIILSILALMLGCLLGSTTIVMGSTVLLASELFAGTMGSDGRSARKWRKEFRHWKGTPA